MVQALVASALASIISLGIVQMIQNAHNQQRRILILATLNEMKSRIQSVMRDQQAFNNTINGAANTGAPFSTLRGGTGMVDVTGIGLATPVKFALYDSSSFTTTQYNLLGPGDSTGPYKGFTEKGEPCDNFYAAAGSGRDSCPFSYRLLIGATCPAATPTSCRNPQLKLVARLVFNPASTKQSGLNELRNLISQIPDGTSIADPTAGVVTEGKYDAVVKRTATGVSRYFQISASVAGTIASHSTCESSTVTDTGGGLCNTGTAAVHPLTVTDGAHSHAGWVIDEDANNLVSVVAAAGTFRFRETGYYKCSALAKSFSTSLRITIHDVVSGTEYGTGSSILRSYSMADARLDTSFLVSDITHDFKLYQICSGNQVDVGSCSLGFISSTYETGDTGKLVTINCEKTDLAF